MNALTADSAADLPSGATMLSGAPVEVAVAPNPEALAVGSIPP